MPLRSHDRPARLTYLVFAIAAVAMVAASLLLSRVVGEPQPGERTIIIPAGTADLLASGEDVDLVPADLEFQLRDRLIVVNEDSADHQIGPFVVAPGERLETVFSEAATVEGFCSLHSTGRITIHINRS